MTLSKKMKDHKDALMTISVFTFLSVFLVAYTFFLFFAVGAEGPRPWHFGTIEDVPGASRYSTSTTKQFLFNATSPEKGGKVIRQHVMEDQGITGQMGASDTEGRRDTPR